MSIVDYDYHRYIALRDNVECKVCSKKFSSNDFLEEKIHKTCCDHFFHKECLNKAYFIKHSRSYFCESCKKPMNYGWDAKEWQKTLEKIRQRVQNELQPQQGIKRKLNGAEEPPQKKHKTHEGALVRYDAYPEYFPEEIWYKILFSLLVIRKEPLNAPDEIEEEDSQYLDKESDSLNAQDEIKESESQGSQVEIEPVEYYKCSEFNDSLKSLLNLRFVSKRFYQFFDISNFSLRLKLFLSQSEITLNNMVSARGSNPLYIACESLENEYLAKLLLMTSEDPNQQATFRDNNGFNAFYHAMTNLQPKFCEFMIKYAKVDVTDELKWDWGSGSSVALGLLSDTRRNDIMSLFEILISNSNDKKLTVIEEILDAGFDEENLAVAIFAIEEVLKSPDIMASKAVLLRMIDNILSSTHLVVKSVNGKPMFNVNCKREVTPLGRYFLDNLFPRITELFNDKFELLKREHEGFNLIHLAVLLNSVKQVQLILEIAGPQALEFFISRGRVARVVNPDNLTIHVNNETSLDMAISLAYHDIAKLLASIMYKLALENHDHETINYILGTYPTDM